MRLHTEKVGPPRALWVPFELGRPLGAPDDAAFQKKVVRAALALLDRTDGPVLEDFPEDAPAGDAAAEDGEGWACPVSLPGPADDAAGEDADADMLAEIRLLQNWYGLAKDKSGRTAVGLSTLGIEDAARFMATWARGDAPDSPVDGMPTHDALRFASDDIKSWYAEAATAQPGRGNSEAGSADIANWFWGDTSAGRVLIGAANAAAKSDDQMISIAGNGLIVPYDQAHRRG